MEANNKLNVGVGTKEPEKMEALPVTVKDVTIAPKEFGGKTVDTLIVMVKHPKKDEVFQMFNVAFLKGKTIKTVGFSITYDSDGQIMKGTAIAELLRFTWSKSLKELIGKTVPTITNEQGYLCLKAY